MVAMIKICFTDVCPNLDPWCSSLDENEKLALEAIHALHHQLDDDKNGNIDLYESNEVIESLPPISIYKSKVDYVTRGK